MRTSQARDRGLRHHLKTLLLPSGRAVRTIQTGILAGLAMDLDFAHDTQRWLGLQERELNEWFLRLSRGIHTAVDVGASDGLYTLYFLAKTPAQRVFAFEPASDSIMRMKKNLALNGFENDPRLVLVPQMAGAPASEQSVTLESFLDSFQFPCLIKVDIDGGEVSLLEGARKLLASMAARWIIEVHSPRLQEQCLEILRLANYRTMVVRNAWWRHFIPELRPGDLNQWIVATPREPS